VDVPEVMVESEESRGRSVVQHPCGTSLRSWEETSGGSWDAAGLGTGALGVPLELGHWNISGDKEKSRGKDHPVG
jgi:hypothetical protein